VRRPDRLGRDYIGRGYGMGAMRVIVDYGFREMDLHLHRIQLSVARFDPAAIRAYQKAGPLRRAAIARVRGLLAGRRVAGAGCPCRVCWR
jgi:RimJ/RimL family protein N-acetyltransferase